MGRYIFKLPLPLATSICCRRGFTLLEILIVIFLMALLSAWSLPPLGRAYTWWQMETAAWQLAGDIRFVQQQAIAGEAEHIVLLFDRVNNLYHISSHSKQLRQRELPRGISFTSVLRGNHRLTFKISGAPSVSGDILLQDKFSRLYYVRVLPATGRVEFGSP